MKGVGKMPRGDYNSSRRIRGKTYSMAQIKVINEEAEQFDCPFAINTAFQHILKRPGVIPKLDNGIVTSSFEKCRGCNCMAFDPENIICLRCK